MGIRKIIHIDMDAFYASVEQRDNPELKGKPVVVGGRPEGRGVVASASYEARRAGVRSAMSARKAAQLCPQAIFVRPTFSKYKEASRQIHQIFRSATDQVEPLSLDEAYLDVTENHWGEPSATQVAARLRSRVLEEVGLTASAGVAPNKFLAKLASDLHKPNALVVIPPSQVDAFVEKLDVEKLWGVGPSTARKLHALGLPTTRELRRCPPQLMNHYFGRFGIFLLGLSRGEDPRPVRTDREPKSRGAETTFAQDTIDISQLRNTLTDLASRVAASLKRTGRKGQTVTLKLRYRDFTTITRSRTLPQSFEDRDSITQTAFALLEGTEAGRRPVRLIGVSVSHFSNEVSPPADSRQLRMEI